MRRACVIGWPVEHSRSPLIHGYWLEQYGIDGAYEKQAVRPEALARFLGSLGAQGYAGANVTLPHKEAALRLAAVADEAARAIGAANTLWLDQSGRLCASNTDAYGFITNLNEQAPGWNEARRPVMVLGAGGAARAILHGLLAEGATRIFLANRTRDRAEALARAFGPAIKVIDWERPRSRAVRLRPARQRDQPRHDRQGGVSTSTWRRCRRTRWWPISSTAHWRRLCSRLRAREATGWSMDLACCCIRRFRVSSAGLACAPK